MSTYITIIGAVMTIFFALFSLYLAHSPLHKDEKKL